MSIKSDKIKCPLCACGCGQPVTFNKISKKWNKFVYAHHNRMQSYKEAQSIQKKGLLSGDKHWNWNPKGEYLGSDARYWVRDSSAKSGFRHRAVVIMEKHIGRRLRKNEQVHHKNEIKTDDRVENLEIKTISDHAKLHSKGEKNGNYGRKHTDEVKYKCGSSMRDKKHTQETRRKMSETHKTKKK